MDFKRIIPIMIVTLVLTSFLSLDSLAGQDKGAGPDSEGDPKASAVKDTTDSSPKTKKPPPDPNRRWIMKQRDLTKEKRNPAKRPPLAFASAKQQAACRSHANQLSQTFSQARFYSIQGDRCKTARFASAFLATAQQCEANCPKGFLAYHGFSPIVRRNMHQLKALGTKNCLGTGSRAPAPRAKGQQ